MIKYKVKIYMVCGTTNEFIIDAEELNKIRENIEINGFKGSSTLHANNISTLIFYDKICLISWHETYLNEVE